MICLHCGKEIKGKRKTKFCSRACKNNFHVAKRRRELKLKAVEYKGGKCEVCGYDKCIAAMVFHHIDDTKKDFGISFAGHTRSWERLKEELDKCQLLCSNCHAEKHSSVADW